MNVSGCNLDPQVASCALHKFDPDGSCLFAYDSNSALTVGAAVFTILSLGNSLKTGFDLQQTIKGKQPTKLNDVASITGVFAGMAMLGIIAKAAAAPSWVADQWDSALRACAEDSFDGLERPSASSSACCIGKAIISRPWASMIAPIALIAIATISSAAALCISSCTERNEPETKGLLYGRVQKISANAIKIAMAQFVLASLFTACMAATFGMSFMYPSCPGWLKSEIDSCIDV